MARSHHLWVILEYTTGQFVIAFTVKKEMVRWLRHLDQDVKDAVDANMVVIKTIDGVGSTAESFAPSVFL